MRVASFQIGPIMEFQNSNTISTECHKLKYRSRFSDNNNYAYDLP
jgi:hypothetical protein